MVEGLRERKKAQTRDAIAHAALRLFLTHGFDQVSITQIAAEADVSRRTLFQYFPTKEDLVLMQIADHQDEAARIVRTRDPGESIIEALRAARLQALAARDPNTGLNDSPESIAFTRLINETPALASGVLKFTAGAIDSLETALLAAGIKQVTAQLMAAQVVVVERTLANRNHMYLLSGISAAKRYRAAVRETKLAYDLLRTGFGEL